MARSAGSSRRRVSSPAASLTHVGRDGTARMVDVGDKPVTAREAVARGSIRMSARARTLVRTGAVAKGDPLQAARLAGIMAATGESWIVNGRFKGGFITRSHGRPESGVHALQMELSNRGYMREPAEPGRPDNWPTPYDEAFAAPIRATLRTILETARDWANTK